MEMSRLNRFANISEKHVTTGGKTSQAVQTFYAQISCDLLSRVSSVYEMDFKLFEYDLDPYNKYCIS